MKIIDVASHDLHDLEPAKLKRSLRSVTTIVASPADPAFAVAREMDLRPGALAVVVDSNGQPLAVLSAEVVKGAFRQLEGTDPDSVEEALRRLLSADPERLTAIRPSLKWCPVHEHYTTPPCPYL